MSSAAHRGRHSKFCMPRLSPAHQVLCSESRVSSNTNRGISVGCCKVNAAGPRTVFACRGIHIAGRSSKIAGSRSVAQIVGSHSSSPVHIVGKRLSIPGNRAIGDSMERDVCPLIQVRKYNTALINEQHRVQVDGHFHFRIRCPGTVNRVILGRFRFLSSVFKAPTPLSEAPPSMVWFGVVGYHPAGFAPILLRLAFGLPHVLIYTVYTQPSLVAARDGTARVI
jgi:hypothetical protein